MNKSIIEKIKSSRQGPCLSVILPTHRTSPERTLDPIEVKKTLGRVKEDIALKYGKSGAALNERLDTLHDRIDFTHNQEGIGFYVSKDVAEVVHFPFPVNEKTNVGDFFHTRELVELEAWYEDYFVLDISLEEVKLFRGSGKHLEAIHNNDFPAKFKDDYEYERSQPLGRGHGFGLKNTEGDKSVVIEERFEKFLKECDKLLDPYLKKNEMLILSGAKQEIGYFQKVSMHNNKVAGKIQGSHSHTPLNELGEQAYEEVRRAREEQAAETIKELEEAFGKEMAITGIENVWRAAREGKGRVLFVEKGFLQKAFVKPGVEHLFLSPPAEVHDIVDDAVESVIRTVLEKNGKVVVTENGKLEKLDRIALLLRYP